MPPTINGSPLPFVDETADAGQKQEYVSFGIREIILTAIIVAVIWYGFKFVNRHRSAAKPGVSETAGTPDPGAVEMRACHVCGVYVATGSSDCGTVGCPYPEG